MKNEIAEIHQQDYKYPDFLIVGAGKSGTTSLFNYLKIHPKVKLPKTKELWFLQLQSNPNKEILNRIPNIPKTIEEYLTHFQSTPTNMICGEASPSYLLFPNYTIENIKKHFPKKEKPKIIIILREPFDKIASLYRFNLLIGTEYLSLNEAINREEERRSTKTQSVGLNYLMSSLYYNQVKLYMDNFETKVFLFDQLSIDPKTLVQEMCEFLGITANPILNSQIHLKIFNTSKPTNLNLGIKIKRVVGSTLWQIFGKASITKKYIPPNMRMNKYYKKHKNNTMNNLPEATLKHVKSILKEDVTKLQSLTGIDLSDWLLNYD